MIFSDRYVSVDDTALVPQYSEVMSRSDVELQPYIFNAPMDSIGSWRFCKTLLEQGQYAVVSRFHTGDVDYRDLALADFPFLSQDQKSRLFFAFGASQAELEKAEIFCCSNDDLNVCLDIAHGHSLHASIFANRIKRFSKFRKMMSGSICTPEAALFCHSLGYTHLRVGIGPGSRCTTRVVTGVGLPNLSAVAMIREEFNYVLTKDIQCYPFIIADGGITESGQAAKYIAAGADAVMLGNKFAGCAETPNWMSIEEPLDTTKILSLPIQRTYRYVKNYRGQASAEMQAEIFKKEPIFVEGISSEIEFTGDTVDSVVAKFNAGLRGACGYVGVKHLKNLINKPEWLVEVSTSSYIEGLPK